MEHVSLQERDGTAAIPSTMHSEDPSKMHAIDVHAPGGAAKLERKVLSPTLPEAQAKRKTAAGDAQEDDEVDAALRDRVSSEDRQHLVSDTRTFANTMIAFLGSGVLGLPFAFRHTGILLGITTLAFVATVSTYAMMLVVQCKYKLKERGIHVSTYGDIGFHALGSFGRTLVNTAIVVSQTGFSIAYLIFIITNVCDFMEVSKQLVISVCVPPLIAFSLIRHMRELAYMALLADALFFIGLTVVYMTDLSYMALGHDHIEAVGVVANIPFFFGVASYCFEGVGMVLPLENGMQYPSHFQPILICTVVIVTTIYGTFGICGYLAFGDATQDVITLNMNDTTGVVMIVKFCLCAGLFCTYPVMLFPVFEVLTPWVTTTHADSPSEEDGDGEGHTEDGGVLTDLVERDNERKIIALRCSVVLVTAVLAVGIPNFGQFIAFIGSTCCTMLAFVLPASFHLKLFPEERTCLRSMVLYVMILLGVASCAAGVMETVQKVLG